MNHKSLAARSALGGWLDEWVTTWDRFWFTPADPATLGLIRLLAGGMLFYTHLIWGRGLIAFFGEHGWLSARAVEAAVGPSAVWRSYLLWIHAPGWLWGAHLVALVILAMLALGLYSRVTSVLGFIVTSSYAVRAHGALFGLDQVNLMLSLYLMVGPCGDAWSLDQWLLRRRLGVAALPVRPKVSANIAIRLIQIHLCVVYLFAGMSKLMGPSWWDGTAMWQAVASLEYQSLDMTWLAQWPGVLHLMTHVTIFWELFYIALVWPRLTRPIVLTLAIPLHMGIAVCLGMVTFGLAMLIANLAFVSPALVRAAAARLGVHSAQPDPTQARQA